LDKSVPGRLQLSRTRTDEGNASMYHTSAAILCHPLVPPAAVSIWHTASCPLTGGHELWCAIGVLAVGLDQVPSAVGDQT